MAPSIHSITRPVRHGARLGILTWLPLGLLLGLAAPGCRDDRGSGGSGSGTTDGTATSDDTGPAPDPASCEGVSCADGQQCVQGQCVTPQTDGGCVRTGDGDSCGATYVCTEVAGKDQCVQAESCANGGGCTPGDLGAVCNDGALPNKGEICIPGACIDDTHCPEGRVCAQAGEGLGSCSDGEFGSPCTSNEHCISGSCFQPSPDQPGLCS